MKNKTKKFMTLAMGAVLAGIVMVSPVKAASSVTGTLNGYTCSGSITTSSNSATATTSWGRSGGTIKATAYAYYTTLSGITYAMAEDSTISAAGITATATRASGYTSSVIGGKGKHEVAYKSGAYDLKWGPVYTTIGTVN